MLRFINKKQFDLFYYLAYALSDQLRSTKTSLRTFNFLKLISQNIHISLI